LQVISRKENLISEAPRTRAACEFLERRQRAIEHCQLIVLHHLLVRQRFQWNVVVPGRESVPRASGPARGTESQGFSFGERFALKKLNDHRLEWLVRTLAQPVPEFSFRHFGSFLFLVLLPLETWENPRFRLAVNNRNGILRYEPVE